MCTQHHIFFGVSKSITIRWAGLVVRVGNRCGGAYRVKVGRPDGKKPL